MFVSLHDNENTSIEAFSASQSAMPGTGLVELSQNGNRLLNYGHQGRNYVFDPNRMFSPKGVKKTLMNYNSEFPREVETRVIRFSDSVLRVILPSSGEGYLVAIHNNTDNEFSVLTYRNSKDAEDVFVNQSEDVDDFFIVTNRSDFEYFKAKRRNVVLQSDDAEDDGSLSVYCQRNGIPYINVEAQHGHSVQQARMMQESYQLIKNKMR